MAYDADRARAALAAFQNSTGLRDFPWEKAAGLGEGTLRKFRTKPEARSMSTETYEKLAAAATDILGRDVSPSELRGDVTAGRPIRLQGVFRSGRIVEAPDSADPETVLAPPDIEDGGAIRIEDDSAGAFESGDLLFFPALSKDLAVLAGCMVVAKISKGDRVLRRLMKGTRRGRWHLLGLTPAQPPMLDQAIEAAAPVPWVKRAH